MVSLAIVGILTVATLKVVAGLSRCAELNRQSHPANLAQGRLKDLLTMDLLHARRYRSTPTGIELGGYYFIDPQSMEAKHLGVSVIYELKTVADQTILLRRQRPENQKEVKELASSSVTALSVRPAAKTNTPPLPAGAWRSMADAVIVTVQWAGKTPSQQEFTVRGR